MMQHARHLCTALLVLSAACAQGALQPSATHTDTVLPHSLGRRLAPGDVNGAAFLNGGPGAGAGGPPPPKPKGCHGGSCGGMAHYPVGPGIVYYSEFDVPGMPKKLDGITYFIYFNIFFSGKGHGRMNQFVPQLMLGNPLCNSSGPPDYKPKWEHHDSWVFGSQYFMEINNTVTNNTAEGHAATGELYPAKQGDIIFTKFELSADWVWTLSMGVKGDPKRVSTVVAAKPFMGLVSEDTTSWSEKEYDHCNVNSCWELYGVKDEEHFPSTGSKYDMRITSKTPNAIKWDTHWNSELESGGCANTSIYETHSPTQQDVYWTVDKPYPATKH